MNLTANGRQLVWLVPLVGLREMREAAALSRTVVSRPVGFVVATSLVRSPAQATRLPQCAGREGSGALDKETAAD